MRRTQNASGADCTERHKPCHAASLQDTVSWSVYAHRSRRYKDMECGGLQVQRLGPWQVGSTFFDSTLWGTTGVPSSLLRLRGSIFLT